MQGVFNAWTIAADQLILAVVFLMYGFKVRLSGWVPTAIVFVAAAFMCFAVVYAVMQRTAIAIPPHQGLYYASFMCINAVVIIAAIYRHQRAR